MQSRQKTGLVVFILLLVCLVGFSAKVFGYYRKIQQGTLDTTGLTFQTTAATQAGLAAAARTAPGNGQLATADDPSLGNPGARLTVVEFADFGCPYSAQESYVVRAVAKEFPNDVRVIYRDFPLVDLHPGADLAAQAGECAQDQNKFWEMHDVLFSHSGDFTQDDLVADATEAGLNTRTFQACLQSGKYADEVAEDAAAGAAAGVVGTPTFFLNGQKIDGAIPFTVFNQLVQAFLST